MQLDHVFVIRSPLISSPSYVHCAVVATAKSSYCKLRGKLFGEVCTPTDQRQRFPFHRIPSITQDRGWLSATHNVQGKQILLLIPTEYWVLDSMCAYQIEIPSCTHASQCSATLIQRAATISANITVPINSSKSSFRMTKPLVFLESYICWRPISVFRCYTWGSGRNWRGGVCGTISAGGFISYTPPTGSTLSILNCGLVGCLLSSWGPSFLSALLLPFFFGGGRKYKQWLTDLIHIRSFLARLLTGKNMKVVDKLHGAARAHQYTMIHVRPSASRPFSWVIIWALFRSITSYSFEGVGRSERGKMSGCRRRWHGIELLQKRKAEPPCYGLFQHATLMMNSSGVLYLGVIFISQVIIVSVFCSLLAYRVSIETLVPAGELNRWLPLPAKIHLPVVALFRFLSYVANFIVSASSANSTKIYSRSGSGKYLINKLCCYCACSGGKQDRFLKVWGSLHP